MKRQISIYIKMLRISHQNNIVAPFLFGALDAGYYDIAGLMISGLGLVCSSVGIFMINEYIDSNDTDKFSLREKVLAGNEVNKNVVLGLWTLFSLTGLILLTVKGLLLVGAVMIVLGNLYSIPPVRFKAYYPWDILSMSVVYILIPYFIPFSLKNLPLSSGVGVPLLAFVFFYGICEGIHFLGDLEADKKAGLRNTNVILGYKKLLKLLFLMSFVSGFLIILMVYRHSNWWYYPLILFNGVLMISFGYARGIVYDLEKIQARFSYAIKTGLKFGNYLVIYQVIVLLIRSRH